MLLYDKQGIGRLGGRARACTPTCASSTRGGTNASLSWPTRTAAAWASTTRWKTRASRWGSTRTAAALSVIDEKKDNPASRWGVGEGGSDLLLIDAKGNRRVDLEATKDGPGVALLDEMEKSFEGAETRLARRCPFGFLVASGYMAGHEAPPRRCARPGRLVSARAASLQG